MNDRTVLAVSRWAEVFETAESRRCKTLTWVAVPVSFNSTGLQRMLDEFDGTTASALYGCWNALLKVAATAPNRGVLAGQKGEPYTAARLARLSGFPADLFEKLIEWCLAVGWLVAAQQTPGLPDRTRPDRTRPDRTGPDRKCDRGPLTSEASDPKATGPVRPARSLFLKTLCERAKDKPQVLELITKPIAPLMDSMTSVHPMQCWSGCGWSDELIAMLADSHRKAEGRRGLYAWYRRQLAAPDPVSPDPSAAGAICVLTLAEQAAHKPGIKNRAAWFTAQLRPSAIPGAISELNTKYFNSAAKFVAEELAR